MYVKSFSEFLKESFDQGETFEVKQNITGINVFDDEELTKPSEIKDLTKGCELEVVSSSKQEIVFKTSANKYAVISTVELKKLPIKML
jgi:mRNA-degrading endonuclease HigB of HigAB toxin-antitoxin module